MSIEEKDELIEEYINKFGEEPLVQYPDTPYGDIYIKLMKRAIMMGKPYTEKDIPSADEETYI